MKGKNKLFTDELKMKIVQEWLTTDVSQRELPPKYCLNSFFY